MKIGLQPERSRRRLTQPVIHINKYNDGIELIEFNNGNRGPHFNICCTDRYNWTAISFYVSASRSQHFDTKNPNRFLIIPGHPSLVITTRHLYIDQSVTCNDDSTVPG
ncbi:hypothetical protein JW960_01195 [candidate division KSB1 bacterium]|nr:hypothetical protein [candidate division KSB1 bacterium]